jgi:hypothetical protein
MYLTMYRTFDPKAAEFTFFSSAPGTFSRTDYICCHKTNINKLKNTELLSCIFSDLSGIKQQMKFYVNAWR